MALQNLLNYLASAFSFRFENENDVWSTPLLEPINNVFEGFVEKYPLNPAETLALALAMAPELQPGFIYEQISDQFPQGGEYPEMGGVKGKMHRGILPNGEMLLYLLAGKNPDNRLKFRYLFDQNHLFSKLSLMELVEVGPHEPKMAGQWKMDVEYLEYFITGQILHPKFGRDFPAERISTELNWDDLVLSQKTGSELSELLSWLYDNDFLMNELQMQRLLKPGFRCLFYGPPGVGKTLAATLLGKITGRPVFRIDLSMIVSKFIGETEQNLSNLFNKAEHKDWILFFDEGDALFGKRTDVKDAHDKYANQEVSYLLQRLESYAGLVILATNYKSNIDKAFARRFQSFVEFEMPEYTERLRLWQQSIPGEAKLSTDVNLEELAYDYEVTGANIVNVIQHACLRAVGRDRTSILIKKDDLLSGIMREFKKEDRV